HLCTGGHKKIEYACGYTRFFKGFDEGSGDGGRLWGWFPDDCIPCNQSWENFPGWDSDREIPRGDQSNNTCRIAYRHSKLIWHLDRSGVTQQPTSLAAHEVRHINGFLHIAAGL